MAARDANTCVCSDCGRQIRLCVPYPVPGWDLCLQANGWNSFLTGWMCGDCEPTFNYIDPRQLHPVCQRNHGAVIPPMVWSRSCRPFITQARLDTLDECILAFWELGPCFVWEHPQLGGGFPSSSPTRWDGSCPGARVLQELARIDFYRPAQDWTNEEWFTLGFHLRHCYTRPWLMRRSRSRDAANWMEAMVGFTCAFCTQGQYLPPDNRVTIVPGDNARATGFLERLGGLEQWHVFAQDFLRSVRRCMLRINLRC